MVDYVYFEEVEPGKYALMTHAVTAGRISVVLPTTMRLLRDIAIGDDLFVHTTMPDGTFTITDSLGSFPATLGDSTRNGERIANPYYTPPAPPPPAPPAADSVPDPMKYDIAKIGHVKRYATVYVRPDSKSDVLGKAYLGEEVQLIAYNVGNTWYRIIYNGGNNAGWVPAKYLVVE